MNPIHTHLDTASHNLPAQNNNQEAGSLASPAIRQDLYEAHSLGLRSEGSKSISNRHPEAKNEEESSFSKYELLASLPPEVRANIISYFNQEDLRNFFYSFEDTIKEVLKAETQAAVDTLKAYKKAKAADDYKAMRTLMKAHEQSLKLCNRHWSIRLLESILNEFSAPIYFDIDIYYMLSLAKGCELDEVLARVPSMRIDFKHNELSYKEFMKLFKNMSIGVKTLEIRGVKGSDIAFSTKGFTHLKSLKIEHSDALKSLKVHDESGELKALSVNRCTALTHIDIQGCAQFARLECLNLWSLKEIKMVEKTRVETFTLKDSLLESLYSQPLADCLSSSCWKLTLKGDGDEDCHAIKAFISKLQQIREIQLIDDSISLSDLSSICRLEKINVAESTLDLNGYDHPETLKELTLADGAINDVNCLKRFTGLQSLIGYVPASTQEFSDTLSHLKNLKRLHVNCSNLDNLEVLASLPGLEELVLDHVLHLDQNSLCGLSELKQLKKLFVSSSKAENIGFLMDLTQLETLSLTGFKELTQEKFEVLSYLTKLKTLVLSFNKVEKLNFLDDLKDLKVLDLSNCCQLAPESFDAIARLENLKSLNLSNRRLPPVSLKFLENLVHLEELDLSDNSKFTQEDCAFLVHLKKLKKLNLRQLPLTHINFLAEFAKLEDLNLMWCRQLKSENLTVLASLKNLRRLNLKDIPVEDLTVFENLRDLEYIDLEGTEAFHRSSPELAIFPSGCEVDGLKSFVHPSVRLLQQRSRAALLAYATEYYGAQANFDASDEDLSDSD